MTAKLQRVCVCGCGSVCVPRRPHANSRPQEQRLEADVSATDPERRSRRSGGVSRREFAESVVCMN